MDYIKIPDTRQKRRKVPLDDIVFIEGATNYSLIHLVTGETHLSSKCLLALQNELPGFVRVHKSALVNPAYVNRNHVPRIGKMTIRLTWRNKEIAASRRRFHEFKPLLYARPVSH